jgi:hypothetical protein
VIQSQFMPEPNRFTPYFLPHSTSIAGLTTIFAGDDRFYNNIFVGIGDQTGKTGKYKYGTEGYNNAKLPVWMADNVYYNGAKPYNKEKKYFESPAYDPEVRIKEEGENVFLSFTFEDGFYSLKGEIITTELLGVAKIPKARFDSTDGSNLSIDKDFFSHVRSSENAVAGPFVDLPKGKVTLKVW